MSGQEESNSKTDQVPADEPKDVGGGATAAGVANIPAQEEMAWNSMLAVDPSSRLVLGKYHVEHVVQLLHVIWRYQRAVASSGNYAQQSWRNTIIDWVKVADYLERVRQAQHGMSQADATHTWTARECHLIWRNIAYGDAPESVAEEDAGSDHEEITSSITKGVTQNSIVALAKSIAEHERAVLDASFVLSGNAHAEQSTGKRKFGGGFADAPQPLYITAVIPTREEQGLGLRIEEVEIDSRQAVVMGDPHPWAENHRNNMRKFERDERAKIFPGQELLAINGIELNPPTLERAVELVASAASPVQLTLRCLPDGAGSKYEVDNGGDEGWVWNKKRQRTS